jgi:hypothetical protein
VNWRIVEVPGFVESVAALGDSPDVSEVVRAMIRRATDHPFASPKIAGLEARVVRSRSFDRCPALRLLYRVEGDVVYLYFIRQYSELGA